jgi:hypothetical protein
MSLVGFAVLIVYSAIDIGLGAMERLILTIPSTKSDKKANRSGTTESPRDSGLAIERGTGTIVTNA